MRILGANGFGFQTIVAAEERSNGVVPTATERKIKDGEMVLTGLSARYKGYFFDKGGYDRYVVCPFVHTIGLYEAEAPFFGPNSEDVLEKNMTVCIDVSLWGHPRLYGARVETGFVITGGGYRPFSPYMDKLIESQMNM